MAITQKRIWQLQQNYNSSLRTGLCLQIRGRLNSGLLFTCLSGLTGRHEIFNTTFEQQDTSLAYPFQVVAVEKADPLLILTDISGLSGEEQQQAIHNNWQLRLSAKPKEGETLDVALLKQDEQLHTLLITAPAIIADTWSLMNITRELFQWYTAGKTQAGDTDDEIFQFAQFADWNNELLSGDEPEAKRIWGSRLDNFNLLTIPLESNTSQPANKFETICETTGINGQQLREYCRANKYSTEQFLLSAWAILAWHYTNKKEILPLGKTVNGRSLQHFEAINGPFVKTLPLQFRITEKNLFRDVCRLAQSETELAGEWQDNFTWKFATDESLPLCTFNFEYIPVKEPVEVYGSLSVQYTMISSLTDWFKLKLSCIDMDDTLSVNIHANTSFFTREALTCISRQFSHLVSLLVEDSPLPVAAMFAISPWEIKQVTEKFNATQRDFITDRSLVSYMEEQALNNPAAPALKLGETVISWQSFNEKANQWASCLSGQYTIVKGDIVAVCLERSPIQIICLFAILKTGAAYLPLDHNIPEERIGYILENSKAKVIITANGLATSIPEATRQVIIANAANSVDALSTTYTTAQRQAEDTFYVMYTSGSTGKPKGVLVPDRGIINYALWFQSEHRVTQRDSAVLFSSIAFDLSYTALWPVLISGGTLHLAAESPVFDPDNLLRILVDEKISYIKLTPSHFNLLISSNLFAQLAPSLSLRLIVLGGESIQVKDIEYYIQHKKGTSFLNHYGPTETTVGVITHLIDTGNLAAFRQKPLIGRPNSNNQAYILDEQNQLLPVGMLGEICIAGKSVTNGYLQQPGLTNEKFIPDTFSREGKLYKTGDLGRWTATGQIEFFGRKDFQVKIHGYRIELEEIEQVLQSSADVTKAFVTVSSNGTGLLAFFTANQQINITALKQFAARKLPDYMLPGLLVQVPQFPLLANGKIDRTNLINNTTMQSSQNDMVLPVTELEQQLAELWKKELVTDQVGIHDNFFDIGGNSFKLVGVFREFSKTCPGKITLTDLFKYNTIHSLAVYLDSKEQAAGKAKQTNFSFEV